MVTEDFHLFKLGCVDVILGMAWLATLGKVQVDWSKLTMEFNHHGRQVEIRGDLSLSITQVSPKALMKTVEVDFSDLLWVALVMSSNSEERDARELALLSGELGMINGEEISKKEGECRDLNQKQK